MANMKTLIRIVLVIFIANGINCLGCVCDDFCGCFNCFKEKDEDKKEEIKEYEEIKDEGNNIAKSLVNWFWFDDKEKNKENDLVLKIFKKKDDKAFPSKDNGDKISIKLEENNNPKITYQKGAEDEPNSEGEKYALFEIKIKGKKVYLYCSDVESSENTGGIFEDTNYVSISVIACDTTNVKDMGEMFKNCSSLTELDIKNFNTKNVTNMKYMFCGCENLKKLNIENFNTKNVTNMESMFYNCSSLKDLNIKNFNTKKVTNMESMFYKCSRLKDLEFGVNFNTENVTDMNGMLGKCSNLTKLDLNNFDTKNVTDMSRMFYKCSSLKNLNLQNFNTSKVKNKENMFDGCKKLPNDTINNILNKINNPQINY